MKIKTVGDLRRFIANLPDETLLMAQEEATATDFDVTGFDAAISSNTLDPSRIILELTEA